MKETTKLYLVAMRSKHTGKNFTFISTSDYANSVDVAVLNEFDFECEVKQSADEIDALLDAMEVSEIDVLKARLKELEAS